MWKPNKPPSVPYISLFTGRPSGSQHLSRHYQTINHFSPLLLANMVVVEKPDANTTRKIGLSCAECRRYLRLTFDNNAKADLLIDPS